jgi:hypothetical protein
MRQEMTDLKQDIATYERLRSELEAAHMGKWALVHDDRLVGVFPSFDAAATAAVKEFGRGPYLIRQIGAAHVTLPASVMFRPVYENDRLRIPQ